MVPKKRSKTPKMVVHPVHQDQAPTLPLRRLPRMETSTSLLEPHPYRQTFRPEIFHSSSSSSVPYIPSSRTDRLRIRQDRIEENTAKKARLLALKPTLETIAQD